LQGGQNVGAPSAQDPQANQTGSGAHSLVLPPVAAPAVEPPPAEGSRRRVPNPRTRRLAPRMAGQAGDPPLDPNNPDSRSPAIETIGTGKSMFSQMMEEREESQRHGHERRDDADQV
jgi:hypothetical protein